MFFVLRHKNIRTCFCFKDIRICLKTKNFKNKNLFLCSYVLKTCSSVFKKQVFLSSKDAHMSNKKNGSLLYIKNEILWI